MTTEEFIIELFCRVDAVMLDVSKRGQAHLYPSEIVTLGLLFALKGSGNRAFYRWLGSTRRSRRGCSAFYRSIFPLENRTVG
ncbi:MAG: hypothetical protein ABI947_00810 [Chloroflexota bacterium]